MNKNKKMMQIEIDEDLYHYLATQTESIGESASSILRRLLHLSSKKERKTSVHSFDSLENKTTSSSFDKPKPIKKNDATEPCQTIEETRPLIDFPREVNQLIRVLNSREFVNETKSVNRFLSVLENLYQFDPDQFALAALSLHGSKRIYIAKDKKILLNSGSNTKPKLIKGSPYWVVTNNNTLRKSLIVANIMEQMKFEKGIIQFVKHQISSIKK